MAENFVFKGIHQSLQLHPAAAHPGTQCRAGNSQAGTPKDGFLPLQRQVIRKLGYRHLGQQAGSRDAFVDDVCIHRHLHQGFALGASPFAADVALHAEDAGHVVQLLGHVLANAL